ncbi:hypothetical protein FRB97_009309 [Tulasnella sp. 331]
MPPKNKTSAHQSGPPPTGPPKMGQHIHFRDTSPMTESSSNEARFTGVSDKDKEMSDSDQSTDTVRADSVDRTANAHQGLTASDQLQQMATQSYATTVMGSALTDKGKGKPAAVGSREVSPPTQISGSKCPCSPDTPGKNPHPAGVVSEGIAQVRTMEQQKQARKAEIAQARETRRLNIDTFMTMQVIYVIITS